MFPEGSGAGISTPSASADPLLAGVGTAASAVVGCSRERARAASSALADIAVGSRCYPDQPTWSPEDARCWLARSCGARVLCNRARGPYMSPCRCLCVPPQPRGSVHREEKHTQLTTSTGPARQASYRSGKKLSSWSTLAMRPMPSFGLGTVASREGARCCSCVKAPACLVSPTRTSLSRVSNGPRTRPRPHQPGAALPPHSRTTSTFPSLLSAGLPI